MPKPTYSNSKLSSEEWAEYSALLAQAEDNFMCNGAEWEPADWLNSKQEKRRFRQLRKKAEGI